MHLSIIITIYGNEFIYLYIYLFIYLYITYNIFKDSVFLRNIDLDYCVEYLLIFININIYIDK